jgi:hypothetical protein
MIGVAKYAVGAAASAEVPGAAYFGYLQIQSAEQQRKAAEQVFNDFIDGRLTNCFSRMH